MKDKKNYVIFDFDGTLIKEQSTDLFCIFILYKLGHYKNFLDTKDFENCEKITRDSPGSIYQPEDNDELAERLNQIHDELPNFVKLELENAGFDISDTELVVLD